MYLHACMSMVNFMHVTQSDHFPWGGAQILSIGDYKCSLQATPINKRHLEESALIHDTIATCVYYYNKKVGYYN